MKNSLLKSIRFNMDDEVDTELYRFLSHLPRGDFSNDTKEYWRKRMLKGKKYESEMEGKN